MTAESKREIVELAERLCADLITADEAARLNQLLRDDAESQRVLLSVTTLHAGLQREFACDPIWAKLSPTRPEINGSRRRMGWNRRKLAVAAGILLVVGTIALIYRPGASHPRHDAVPIATVRQTLNAQWAPGNEPKDDILVPGRVRLETGLVEIEFRTGTVAILKGPVDVDFRGVDSAFLHSGQMLIRVAQSSVGAKFQVETPTSQLVDVGTEFGVEVEDDGGSVLQVYEGEVLASAKADVKEPQRILKGEAVRLGASILESAFWPERFVRLLPGPRDPLGRGVMPYNRSRHNSIKIPRARAALTIDADLSDWNLAHRIRSECEPPFVENYYLEAAMMYDEEFLYVSAHVGDPHSMQNQYSSQEPFDKHGMGGGVALRVSTDRQAGWPLNAEQTRIVKGRNPQPIDVSDKLSFIVLWYNAPEQQACIHLRYGMDLHGRQVNPPGYRGAFRRDADGRGYTLEYAIPWKVLHAESDPPRAGDILAAMWLVHWSDVAGRNWQGQLIDVMKPDEPGWNFKRAATWGKAIYLP